MINHDTDGPHLVMLHGCVDCVSDYVAFVEFVVLTNYYLGLGAVEDGEFLFEVVTVGVREKGFYGVTVESEKREHVSAVEFQEGFEEDGGITLLLDDVEDVDVVV